MDKPMTPGGPVGSKPPGPDNSGSNQDFGAGGGGGSVAQEARKSDSGLDFAVGGAESGSVTAPKTPVAPKS